MSHVGTGDIIPPFLFSKKNFFELLKLDHNSRRICLPSLVNYLGKLGLLLRLFVDAH